MKPCIRNLFLVLLVINFVALVIALTNIIPDNPMKEYSLWLVVSFVLIAGVARGCCKKSKQESRE